MKASSSTDLLIILLSCTIAVFISWQGLFYICSDDALFYLQIAYQQLTNVFLPTFNGVEPTNGFHPLHGFILIIFKALAPNITRESFAYLAYFWGVLLSYVSVALFFKIINIQSKNRYSALFFASIFAFYLFGGMYLSEAAINAFMHMICFLFLQTRLKEAGSLQNFFIAGLLLGLLSLARLDNALVLPILFFYWLFIDRISLLKLSGLVLGTSSVLLPYLVWNKVNFGSAFPVSGLIKSSFPVIRPFAAAWADTNLLSVICISCLLILLFVRLKQCSKIEIIDCFFLCAIFNWFYYFLFQYAAHHSWYFVQAIIVILIIASKSLPKVSNYINKSLAIASVITLIGLPVYTFTKVRSYGLVNFNEVSMGRPWQDVIYKNVATSAAKYLMPGQKVLTFDLPGYLAYYGKLSIFAVDCLTLNKVACAKLYSNPADYIKHNNITSIIWSFPKGCKDNLELHEYYTRRPVGSIQIDCSRASLLSEGLAIYSVPIKWPREATVIKESSIS